MDPAIETFGNAMREFALTVGKRNLFPFGEVYDDEEIIAPFIGRNGGKGPAAVLDVGLAPHEVQVIVPV